MRVACVVPVVFKRFSNVIKNLIRTGINVRNVSLIALYLIARDYVGESGNDG